MSRQSIVDFIAEKRADGKSDSEITHFLLGAGWHMDIIHKALHDSAIHQRNFEPILDIKKQPFKKPVVLICIGVGVLILLSLIAAFI